MAPVDEHLDPPCEHLNSFNTWLCRRIAAGAGPVRDVGLDVDQPGRAVAAACHLARCGTQSLHLHLPSAGLLEAACTIGSLTGLKVHLEPPPRSLDLLGALRQLRSLSMAFDTLQRGEPPAWRLALPALTRLDLAIVRRCEISLDDCSALQQLSVSEACGLALTASRPLQQLTQLHLWWLHQLALPWQHMPELLKLALADEVGLGVLHGATRLTALRDLHVVCRQESRVPRGAWLASVTRLVLEDITGDMVSDAAEEQRSRQGGVCECWPPSRV